MSPDKLAIVENGRIPVSISPEPVSYDQTGTVTRIIGGESYMVVSNGEIVDHTGDKGHMDCAEREDFLNSGGTAIVISYMVVDHDDRICGPEMVVEAMMSRLVGIARERKIETVFYCVSKPIIEVSPGVGASWERWSENPADRLLNLGGHEFYPVASSAQSLDHVQWFALDVTQIDSHVDGPESNSIVATLGENGNRQNGGGSNGANHIGTNGRYHRTLPGEPSAFLPSDLQTVVDRY